MTTYQDANWSLVSGSASGVVASEIDSAPGKFRPSPISQAGVSQARNRTCTALCALRSAAGGSRSSADWPAFPLLPEYLGLRLHTRGRILFPPSCTADGNELGYVNPYALLLPAPCWLHSVPDHR
jgi:hypothetical protein